jgi:hypothetical protein
MLDAFIIEEIKRSERGVVREDRPAVELPLPPSEPAPSEDDVPPEGPDRGVVIIDYT